jgi:hypothetical protein
MKMMDLISKAFLVRAAERLTNVAIGKDLEG